MVCVIKINFILWLFYLICICLKVVTMETNLYTYVKNNFINTGEPNYWLCGQFFRPFDYFHLSFTYP